MRQVEHDPTGGARRVHHERLAIRGTRQAQRRRGHACAHHKTRKSSSTPQRNKSGTERHERLCCPMVVAFVCALGCLCVSRDADRMCARLRLAWRVCPAALAVDPRRSGTAGCALARRRCPPRTTAAARGTVHHGPSYSTRTRSATAPSRTTPGSAAAAVAAAAACCCLLSLLSRLPSFPVYSARASIVAGATQHSQPAKRRGRTREDGTRTSSSL